MTPLPNNSVEGICRSSRTMEGHSKMHNCSSGSDSDDTKLNLFCETDRLRTFSNWSAPFTDKRELAAAGFYYVNYVNKGDLVKCPFCNLEISRWEEGASAFDLHKRRSPHCNFMQQTIPSTVPNSTMSHVPQVGRDICGGISGIKRQSSISDAERAAREKRLQEFKINTSATPLFPNYASLEDRLKSYEKWPENFKLRPIVLSEAGFYYTGNDVKTVCFQCGGCLSWDEFDDPLKEHDYWFPNCYFITSYKSRIRAEELAAKIAAFGCIPPRSENLGSPSRNANFAKFDLSQASERLKTFVNWPLSFISKEELAEAGFYYTNVSDRVICHYCNVEVGNWEIGDDPAGEHLKHSPHCRHSSHCRMMLQKKAVDVETSQPPNPTVNGIDTCGPYDLPHRRPPKYPHYSSLESRMNSFRNWPESSKIRPLALCEAGFFYAGIGDHTLCYYCGGGLKDWKEQDDPWIEHAQWFSDCEFVLSTMGSAFIQEASRRNRETLALTREEVIAAVNTIQDIINTTVNQSDVNIGNVNENKGCANVEDVTGAESEPEHDEKSKLICKICFTREWNKFFYPCGHMACSKCANNLTNCAFCRKPILDRVQMYCP